MNKQKNKNRKEILSKIRDKAFEFLLFNIHKGSSNNLLMGSIDILSYDLDIQEEIKILKVINLDNFEDFSNYLNYDHFLIFKFDNNYYYCDTEFTKQTQYGIIKINDYNLLFRQEKINKINNF